MADPKKALDELKKKYGVPGTVQTNDKKTTESEKKNTGNNGGQTARKTTNNNTWTGDAAKPKKALEELKKKYSDAAGNTGSSTTTPGSKYTSRNATDKGALADLSVRLQTAKEEERTARYKLEQYSGSRSWRAATKEAQAEQDAARKEYADKTAKRKALEDEIERLNYQRKYQDKTYDDTFTGQFGANYTVGRMQQDSSLAWNKYLLNPTDENRVRAEAIDALMEQFQINNQDALDDEGAVLPWVSKSAANYLPQLIDQTKYSAAGGITGAVSGSFVPVIGTALGAKAGVVAGSGVYSFNTMRGAAYKGLRELGVDDNTARAAANDEAVISSLIEMADTGVDIATLGVGKLLNLIGKGGVKAVAGGAAEGAAKKLLKGLAGYGLNIGGEMLEEATQEAVSIANERRAANGEAGIWNLAKDATGAFTGAITGNENDENRNRIWEAAKEGGKIAAMMGGATRVATGAANTVITNAAAKKTGATVNQMGDDVVQAVIDEGLESGKDTESYKQATALQEKRSKGQPVTDREVGRLYQENVKAIDAEQAAEKAKTTQSSVQRPTLTTFQQQVRKDTGYGEYGVKAFTDLMDTENMPKDQLRTRFQTAYEAGMTNMPRAKANLTTDIQRIAFNAGKQDYIMSQKRDVEKSKFATVYGKESGFIQTDAANGVQQSTIDMLHEVSKDLGIKTRYEEAIVLDDGSEANGSMSNDGIFSISRTSEHPEYVLVAHEGLHRMQQLAPDAYYAFRNFAVQTSQWYEGRLESGVVSGSQVEGLQLKYQQHGMTLQTDEAMDEIAAQFAEKMFSSDEDVLNTIRDGVKDVDTRNALQKFFDIVKDLARKLKETVSRLKNKGKTEEAAQVQDVVDNLEHARKLWNEAYQASKAAAREKTRQDAQTASSAKQDAKAAASVKAQEEAKRHPVDTESEDFYDSTEKYSIKVTDKKTLDFLNSQETITTYKTMQLVDGKLYPPMASRIEGKFEDYSELGKWEQATEHPELIRNGNKFKLDKGKGQGSLEAAYNPYMHSSNLVINDQFTGAYTRNNLVTVECEVPVSEMTSGYHAKYAKDSVGWHSWHTGTVAGQIRNAKGTERQVFLSRWIKPVRIVPDSEVASMYKDLLDGTDVDVPDNVVTPSLLAELKKAGVKIKESGRVKYSLKDSTGRTLTEQQAEYFKDSKIVDDSGNLLALYHGTTAYGEITKFKKGRSGWLGPGIYLSSRKNDAKKYADAMGPGNGTVYELYANVTNPLVVTSGNPVPEILMAAYGRESVYKNRSAKQSNDPNIITPADIKKLQSKGYDGIRWDFGKSTEVSVFSPEQIKRIDNQAPTSSQDVRFSLKNDNEYMAAVDAGDMKKAASMVDDAAESAMPDSKIRDKNGKLKPVYHGTKDMFYEFDTSIKGGVNGTAEGFGIYTSDSTEVTSAYGDRQIKMYANITKPATSTKKTITAGKLAALIKDTCKKQAQKLVDDGEYDSVKDALMDTWVSNYVYTYGIGMERAYRETANSILQMNDSDMAVVQEVMSGMAIRDYAEAFDFYHNSLTPITGFDGIVTQWENKSTGKKSNIILAFDSSQLKSADPVVTDDSGNVIPLSERFDRSKKDIRFSMKEQNKLMKENAQLKETVEGLREQFKTTKFAQVDKKSLDRFTKQLLKDYKSGAEINDTRDALNDLYTYIANGENGESPVWNEAYSRAYDVAVSILENASTLDDEMYQEYADLRKYLRTVGMTLDRQYTHDLYGYENLNEFRKAYMGRIKLVNDGLPVDAVYQELAARYPEFFDENRDLNQADMLITIAETLDKMQPVEVNPYSYNMREAATWLANDIMERFYELPQAKPTFADKAETKLTKQVIKDSKKLERLREQKNERIKDIIEKNREKVKTVRAEERVKREEAVQAVKEHYKAKEIRGGENRRAREIRAKIIRHVGDMSEKLLKPTDKQHIPESLRGPVAAMLEAINLESNFEMAYGTDAKYHRVKPGEVLGAETTKRTEAFLALKEEYARIAAAQDGDMVIDPSLLGSDAEGIRGSFDAVIAMRDIRLADMNVEQLSTVWSVIRAVEHSISTAGKMLANEKYERTSDWADAFVDDTGSRRAKKSLTKNHAMIDMETPYTFFSHYGEAGHAVYRMLRDAQDHQQVMVNKVAEEASKIVDSKTVKALEKKTHTFTTERGDKLTLTTAHIMELRELMKREQAQDHLMKGGIVQPEIKSARIRRGTDAILLTAGDLVNITKSLTPEQAKIADDLQALTTGLLADFGNDASMKAYGYKKFTGTDYWPIKSAREAVHSNIEKGGNNTRSIKNIGMAKAVMPHANNPLDIAGIFSTFSNHASDMTDYAAWLCPMEDANRLYNFKFKDEAGQQTGKTIKGLLDRVGGAGSQKYWHNLMEDIQNGINAPGDSAMWDIVGKSIGNFKGAAVGANLRVVIQQPTAFFRANSVLSPADLSRGLVSGVTKGSGWKKALQYSPIAMRKDVGGFDISNPYQMNEILFDSRTGVRKLNDALSAPAGWADAVTWGRLWNACEWAVSREQKDLEKGSTEFYSAVNRKFTEVIDQTQVVDGVLQRSQIMRSSNAVVKQATSFMGEPIMSYNLMLRAYDQVRYEQNPKRRGKALKALGRAATALVVTNVVNALAQSVIDGLRDDDEDKEYLDRFWSAFTGLEGDEESAWDKAVAVVLNGNVGSNMNPLDQIPFVKDALSLFQGYDVNRTELEVIADMISAGQTVAQSVDGTGKKTRAYAIKELFAAGAKAFGIPASNLAREVWSIARSIAVGTDNIPVQYEMEKAIYNLTDDSNKARYYDIMFRALVQGDMASYQRIRDDLMNQMGLDGVTIDNAMKSRYKKAQAATPGFALSQDVLDLIGTRDREATEDDEDGFSDKDLNAAQYQRYSTQRADDYRDIMDDLQQYSSYRSMDADGRNALEAAAWSYAKETALEDASGGQYQTDTKWIDYAQDSNDIGLTVAEYIMLKEQYSDTALRSDGVYDAYDAGIPVDVYLEAHDTMGDIKADKDANGKSISGSRKEKIIDYLNALGLTYEQYLYLLGTEYDTVKKTQDYISFFGSQK